MTILTVLPWLAVAVLCGIITRLILGRKDFVLHHHKLCLDAEGRAERAERELVIAKEDTELANRLLGKLVAEYAEADEPEE